MRLAVIETGGKQLIVFPGKKVRIEKIEGAEGSTITFDKVLLTAEGNVATIGSPHVQGAKVEGNIIKTAKDDKKMVFRYHSKTRYRKKKGHRQLFTEVLISSF